MKQGAKPSNEQLCALKTCLDIICNPSCDFAIRGPHHPRMMKKLKCVGLVMGKDGVFRSEEFPGPPTFKHWEGSFEIMENGYLLTKISNIGNMEVYHGKINHYYDLDGPDLLGHGLPS